MRPVAGQQSERAVPAGHAEPELVHGPAGIDGARKLPYRGLAFRWVESHGGAQRRAEEDLERDEGAHRVAWQRDDWDAAEQARPLRAAWLHGYLRELDPVGAERLLDDLVGARADPARGHDHVDVGGC